MTKPPETLEFLGFMGKEGQFQDGVVITVDGSSGSGKSTLSRRLAERLGWPFLDSGAWYRALTWACLEAGVDPSDGDAVKRLFFTLDLRSNTDGVVVCDGTPLTGCLRTPRIDQAVSQVADHFPVREALNERMRSMVALHGSTGLVADGRDAGTNIFPDAALKIFVEASLDVRSERRFAQMQADGIEITFPEVHAALAQRDARDAARGDAAPHPTDGSRILNNNERTVEEAVGCLLTWTEQLNP